MPPKPGGRCSEKERRAVSWRRGCKHHGQHRQLWYYHIFITTIPTFRFHCRKLLTPVFSRLGQVSMPSSTRKVSSQRKLHEVRSYQYHCFPDGTPYSTLLILQPPGLCLVKALRQTTRPPASQPSIHQNDMFLILTYAGQTGQTAESRS